MADFGCSMTKSFVGFVCLRYPSCDFVEGFWVDFGFRISDFGWRIADFGWRMVKSFVGFVCLRYSSCDFVEGF
jgi:hypothetical protein